MSRILVVDDEPDIRFMIRLFMEHAGHEVTEAHHGAAALQSVREATPDLVITDIMMAVMGGVELIRQLRANPATAWIPIVVVSGDSELSEAADVALQKPIARDQLVQTVNALLSRGVG